MNSIQQHSALKLLPLPYLADSLQYFHTIAAQLPMPLILQSDITTSSATCKTEPRGRFDVISAAPEYWLQTHNGNIDWYGCTPSFAKDKINTGSLSTLHNIVTKYLAPDVDYSEGIHHELPFCGGLMGYCSYDLAREYVALKSSKPKDIDIPDMQFGFYGWACIQDHTHQKSWLVIHPQCDSLLAQRLPSLLTLGNCLEKYAGNKKAGHLFSLVMSQKKHTQIALQESKSM